MSTVASIRTTVAKQPKQPCKHTQFQRRSPTRTDAIATTSVSGKHRVAAPTATHLNHYSDHVCLVQLRMGISPRMSDVGTFGRVKYSIERNPHPQNLMLDQDFISATLNFDIQGKVVLGQLPPSIVSVGIAVDCTSRRARILGNGLNITDALPKAMKEFITYLSIPPENTDVCNNVNLLYRAATFLSAAPVGFKLPRSSSFTDPKLNNVKKEPIQCLEKWTNQSVHWKESNGTRKSSMVTVWSTFPKKNGNAYNCMGGCGSGCDCGDFATQACLNHDTCSWYESSTKGALDANCGALWIKAAPDFLFGSVCEGYKEDIDSKLTRK